MTKKSTILVALILLVLFTAGIESKARQFRRRQGLSLSDRIISALSDSFSTTSCHCGWATNAACANPDGTHCHRVCCSGRTPTPAPTPAPAPAPRPPTTNPTSNGWQGVAKTTRYWDCCKPSCAWPSNVPGGRTFVRSCLRDGTRTAPANARNICGGGGDVGGPNFMCNDQQPFTGSNGLLYGFAASNVDCCTCYELEFIDTALAGKRMIIQVTNKGGDLGRNHFDLQIPGGGLGIFDGCTPQFGTWNGGARYGGISSINQCQNLPAVLRPGCQWRFRDFKNADNPNVRFKRVTCPQVLSNKSGCRI